MLSPTQFGSQTQFGSSQNLHTPNQSNSNQLPYHQWVEDKFEQYREEIRTLQSRVGNLQQQLLVTDSSNKKVAMGTTTDREEDLKTIAKLEQMVERFRTESQKVLNDHLKLQARYQDTSSQQEKLKQRIMQLDVELRQMYENSSREKSSLEASLEKERATRRQLATDLQLVTVQLAKESEAHNAADRAATEVQRQLVSLELANREGTSRTEKTSRVVQELKEQVRFLTATIEEQRLASQKDLEESMKAQEKFGNTSRAHEHHISTLEAEIQRLKGRLEAANSATERHISDSRAADEEAQLRVNHFQKLAGEFQHSQIVERAKANEALASIMAEKESLLSQLLAANAKIQTIEGDQISILKRVDDSQSIVAIIQQEKVDLVNQLQEHVVSSNSLCTKLASVEGQLNQTVLDGGAAQERLDSLHDEVVRLQKTLSEVTLEREKYRDAMNELDKECAELQKRLGEKQLASSDSLMQLRELSGRNDSLALRVTQTASDRAVLHEKLETLEHRIAQLKAERDVATADALKASRDSQRQAIAHSQEIDDIRMKCEQTMAEAARISNKQLQDALLDEQQKRQQALAQAYAGIDTDPRVRRALETEEKNISLQKRIHELEDRHTQETAEHERTLRAMHSEFTLKERECEDLQQDRDRERDVRRAHDECNAEQLRTQHRLRTEFSIFIQNSESWLREVLQKVAILTMQKLHSDFIISAHHRHQLFELNTQLRESSSQNESAHEELREAKAKIDALNEALQNEIVIGKEMSAKFAGRNPNMSPTRGSAFFKGTLSAMTNAHVDPTLAADDSFVLQTRWELVSALCGQELRCEAATESSGALFRLWQHGVKTNVLSTEMKADLSSAVVDVVELVQSLSNAQGTLIRSFFTDREKALLHNSKAAVL